jgi:importin subunit beta-1
LSTAFPNGDFAEPFRSDWLTQLAKEVRANRDFHENTRETARWARLEIKKQESLGGRPTMA